MPSIDSINNIKNTLGYAVKKRKGYYNEIKNVDKFKGNTIESFNLSGFIKTGYKQRQKTFKITELGDEYYRNLFGEFNYYYKRFSGVIERFRTKIFK